jgi:hypothetical protein
MQGWQNEIGFWPIHFGCFEMNPKAIIIPWGFR